MGKYKLVIFDFDGTLFATHEAIIHCVTKTFEKYKAIAPSRELIYESITKGIGLEDTFKFLNPALGISTTIQQWVDSYREFYQKEGETKMAPFDNVESVLRDIASTNIPIVVISNKGIAAIQSALDNFHLNSFVSLIVGDTKGIKKKPDPMIYNEIIKPKFGTIAAQDTLIIGDTSADLLFAKNIGADSCWASYGYGAPDECRNINPTYSIKDLNELSSILIDQQQKLRRAFF
jgi:phosphoglycolate phosphatase